MGFEPPREAWRRAQGSRALLWIAHCQEAGVSYSWASQQSSLQGGQANAVMGQAAVLHAGRRTKCLVLCGFGNGHVLSVFGHDYRLVLFLS